MNEQVETLGIGPATRAVSARWGDLSGVGFTAIPNTLLQAQSRLGLSPTDVVVLLNLAMHWWSPEDLPFPRSDTIASRSGLSRRTVQRTMTELEKKGLIARVMRGGRRYCDLSGLKAALADKSSGFAWRREKLRQNSGREAGVQAGRLSEE